MVYQLITNKLRPIDSKFIANNKELSGTKLLDYQTVSVVAKEKFIQLRDSSNYISLHELNNVYFAYSTPQTGGRGVALYSEDGELLSYSSAALSHQKFSDMIANDNFKELDVGAYAGDRFTGGNMCHVLYDHICRAHEMVTEGFDPKSIYLLENTWDWAKQIGEELLGSLGYLEAGKVYKFERLYLASNALVGELHHPTVQHCPSFINLLKSYRERLDVRDGTSQYLYQNRLKSSARKVNNEIELIEHLKEKGFESLDTTNMEVREQLKLFKRSNVIVAPHGAGLSNLFACKPNTKVYELFFGKGTKAYEVLCDLFDLEYVRLDLVLDKGKCDYSPVKSVEFSRISIPDKKIFQIGFNKSGTVSIHRFFESNNIKSVHWDRGALSKRIARNYRNGTSLLEGYEEYQAYTDIEHSLPNGGFFYSAEKFYRELDNQYPNSLFILNYRPIEPWLKSRENHGSYLFNTMRADNLSRERVLDKWRNEYQEHIEECKRYFSGSNNFLLLEMRPENMCVLGEFLASHGFDLNQKEIAHQHKTESKKKKGIDEHIQGIKSAAFFIERQDVKASLALLEVIKGLNYSDKEIDSKYQQYKKYLSSILEAK